MIDILITDGITYLVVKICVLLLVLLLWLVATAAPVV